MEVNLKSVKQEISNMKKITGKNKELLEGIKYDYLEAMDYVKEQLKERLSKESQAIGALEDNKEIKDKTYLKKQRGKYNTYITDIIAGGNIIIKDYDRTDFINDMVEEFAGYSILSDAFADPDISDIFVIDWQTIFVEHQGENKRYHRTFRDEKHYYDVLNRFVETAGLQLNVGESKIVDFELYQDRGCATSEAVSPRSRSLTLRKHKEDHINKHQIVEWDVLNENMATFMGMLVRGECNIIYAGITGTGKTTTIRALLDYYISQANKRMLVCEDTQELFPKNPHTLELVSIKDTNEKLSVPLSQLIITALRLKPKYIAVGEVRGPEAEAAVEAMETGHSTIFTMHGGNAWNIVNRLITKYLQSMPTLGIDVVERIIGASVDYICVQDNIPGIGRKLTTITEVSYDFEEKHIVLTPICRYDFEERDFVWEGRIHREKAEKMLRSGVPLEEVRAWMNKEIDEIKALGTDDNWGIEDGKRKLAIMLKNPKITVEEIQRFIKEQEEKEKEYRILQRKEEALKIIEKGGSLKRLKNIFK